MRILHSLVAVAIVSCPARVRADDPLLEKARELAQQGEAAAAAKAFGQAAKVAQSRGGVLREQAVADALVSFLNGLPPAPTGTRKVSVVMAVAAVLPELDWNRNGAFVSCAALAADALCVATATGVFDGARTCARRLEGWALARKKGRPVAAKALRLYASALDRLLRPAGRDAAARTIDALDRTVALEELEEAQAEAIRHRFPELNAHVTTELVARLQEGRDGEKAMAALKRAVDALPDKADLELLIAWSTMLRTRLGKDAERYEAVVTARFAQATRPAAGAGGAGGSAASAPRSPLGTQWNRFKRGRRLLDVLRTDASFRVSVHFQRGLGFDLKPAHGQRHRDAGGLHLAFHGARVAVRRLDLTGRDGLPGASPRRSRWLAYYPLASGETLSFDAKHGLTFRR